MSSENYCARCGKASEFKCGRCMENYCGIKCQRLDWTVHKKACQEIPKLIRIDSDLDDVENAPKNKAASNVTDESVVTETPATNRTNFNDSCESLSTRIQKITIDDTEKDKETAPLSQLEQTPQNQKDVEPSKKFYINDVEFKKLKEGKNIKLIITDSSFIDELTLAVVEHNAEHRTQLVTDLQKVSDYCQNVSESKRGYNPDIYEICLAIFDEDGKWYRANVLEQSPVANTYEIEFIDFGNVATVSSANLMPIVEELLFPTYVNFCRITNIEPKDIPTLKATIVEKPNIICDVKLIENLDIFNISINNLEAILNK